MPRLPGRSFVSACLSLLVALTLVLAGLPQPVPAAHAQAPGGATYRARITLQHPYDATRLAQLGLELYARDGDTAVVLADEEQLATLARRGFRPDDVASLATLTGLAGQSVGAAELAAMAAPDSDGDGLTDDEEAMWCTDPHDNNSDSPLPPSPTNPSDGDEVQAILNGITAYGPPFALWPQFRPYNPNGTCPDGDFDGVPDQAEEFIIGTSPLRESSDKDKFDDGQELFGVTFCPGGSGPCGYGILPRAEDAAWVSANLPAWVLPPGNSPWVAAFPLPEVEVVPSSIKMTAKTTITAGKTITAGEERTYGTATTTGTSVSHSDSTTWNNWQEVSTSTPAAIGSQAAWLWPILKEIATGIVVSLAADALKSGVTSLLQTPKEPDVSEYVEIWPGAPLEISQDVLNELNPRQCTVDVNGILDPTCRKPDSKLGLATNKQVVDLSRAFSPGELAIDSFSGELIYTPLSSSTPTVVMQPVTRLSGPAGAFATTTRSEGREWGGSSTDTHTQYEEQTISKSSTEQFSTAWQDATAVDTAHAADLRFTYRIVNNGSEYARQVTSLLFNLYIGNDPHPVTTYVAVGSGGQIAALENLFPGESHTYTSNPIPLTLDQMRAVDEGAPIRVVMEDIAFGQDQVFYQDALNGSVTVAMEDGYADGDETVDSYLIALWAPTDTLQDVLKRYFPTTEDAAGNLLSIATPEFTTNPPTFVKHALTGTSWWNIYLSEGLDYTGDFKTTPARPGTTALIRILSDRDLDGYNDRNEIRLGTDPDDPASHPTPELLAGYTRSCNGDDCTVLLSFLNTGNYDAYGVEAVMYSPDGLAEITNNTVGGSGRVPAGEQVVVGARVLSPDLTHWPVSTSKARPYSAGYFSGTADRTYTFTAAGSGSIGSGTLTFNWSDGEGGSGTVNFGSGYNAPLPRDVAQGVQIGFQTGSVVAGESFTVRALTPRDTFQYTCPGGCSAAAEPVIVVSYNDPQGNHRFVLPSGDYPNGAYLAGGDLQTDLSPLSGKMLPDPGVDIATTSSTQANFILNAPHPISITNAHLFVEYIDSDGNVDREDVFSRTLATGPTVVPLTVDTNAYDPAETTLLAFMTDSQGNIIDSSARPLAAFWADPLPEAVLAAGDWQIGTLGAQSVPDPWDFGTVEAGTLLSAQLTLANTGLGGLRYALTGGGGGVSVAGKATDTLAPAQTRVFYLTMDIAGLPAGPFTRTLTLRTSDPNHPEFAINLAGTISGGAAPGSGTATAYQVNPFRPWDQYVAVPGPQNLNATILFTHTIADQAARMHPLYLYTEDGATLKGVGEYGPDFIRQTAPFGVFGTGVDGDLVVGTGVVSYTDNTRSALAVTASAGQTQISLSNANGFMVDNEVLVIQMQGTGAGDYQFRRITGINGNNLTLRNAITATFTVGGNSKAQVLRVPQYQNVTVQNGGKLTAHPWNGSTGGVIALRATGTISVSAGATISADAIGFLGGLSYRMEDGYDDSVTGQSGESPNGPRLPWIHSWDVPGPTVPGSANGGGGAGGAGQRGPDGGGGGGGGSYGSQGTAGVTFYQSAGGVPGTVYGAPELSRIFLGSGGGGGGKGNAWCDAGKCDGGNGGGIIVVAGRQVSIEGYVSSNGGNGTPGGEPTGDGAGPGGGGSGGSVLIVSQDVSLGSGRVSATGGYAHYGVLPSGHGGNGRIHLDCDNLSGTTNPSADVRQVNFYIMRQLPDGPDADTDLQLPDAITTTRTLRYQAQYGQRSSTINAGNQDFSVRLPNRQVSAVQLSALVEPAAGSGSTFTYQLDFGDDGAYDWVVPTQPFTGPVRLDTTITQSRQIATALNTYIQGQASSAESLVIPIRVSIDTPADIFLFNLAATPGGDADLRAASLEVLAENGAAPDNIAEGTPVTLSAVISNTGTYTASRFTTAFYDGAPGAEGVLIGSRFVEAIGPAASTVVTQTWNTTGLLGPRTLRVATDVATDVLELDKTNNTLTATAVLRRKPDLLPVSLAVPDARRGETVAATAVISNGGEADVYTATVALYRGEPISGTLVATTTLDVPAGGTATATLPWTPPAAGPATLWVVADPDDGIVEALESNNAVSITVRAGWDHLVVDGGHTGADDPVYAPALGYGRLVTGTVTSSCGAGAERTYRQASSVESLDYRFDNLLPLRRYHLDLTFGLCSGERWVDLFVDGRPAAESALGLHGSGLTATTTITTALQTVSLLLDPADTADGSVTLSIRRAQGLGGPPVNLIDLHEIRHCYRDSGPGEPAWSAANGCGYVDDGSSDVFDGWGSAPEQTVRFAEGGQVRYKFSGLIPGTGYNVGLTFAEGDGAGRRQEVRLDGTQVATVTVSTAPQRLILPIPSGTYADGDVLLAVANLGSGSAVVSEVALEQVTRRYPGAPPPEPAAPPAPLLTPPQVAFSNFGAAWQGNQVRVEWGTTTEINNSAFTLFRSTDTKAWVDTHTAPSSRPCGNFTGTAPVTYVYSDTAVLPGNTYYYRIQYSGAGCGELGSAVYMLTAQASGDLAGHSIPLGPGWRLMSFRPQPPLPSPPLVLDSITGRYDRVLGEHGIYASDLAPVYNTLAELHAGRAYYLRITDTVGTSALVQGWAQPVTSPVPLHAGWNWLGYRPEVTLPVTQALQSIAGHYQRVLSLDQVYDAGLPGYSTLQQLRPGQGYLLYATSAVTLTYPASGGVAAGLADAGLACDGLQPTPYFTLIYGPLTLDRQPALVGTRVEVVTPRGELAGCFVVTTAGQFGLMHVYGADSSARPPIPGFLPGEPLAFRVAGQPARVAGAPAWQNDWSVRPTVVDAAHPGLTVYLPVVVKQ